MLTDPHVETFITANIVPQANVRRLANGSIDYTFYDRRAHHGRGVAFRAAGRAVTALVARVVDAFAGGAAGQPQLETLAARHVPAHRQFRRDFVRSETATTARQTYSKAA